MKKQLTILLALFLTGAGMNSINAQISEASGVEPLTSSVKMQAHTNLSEDEILTNVRKRFQRQFPNAELESWMKTNDGYSIRFSSRSIENLVFYNTKANITGQVRYYKSETLPFDVRFQVESAYHDYKIVSVQEITVEKSKAYLVAIEATNDWKIIRVGEDGMDVYKEYRKG